MDHLVTSPNTQVMNF